MDVKPPYAIAVLGAPGSGKAATIDAFQSAAKPWISDQLTELVAWPNAGTSIEEECDQAMGVMASYREDIWSFFTYLEREMNTRNRGDSFIQNGTMLGTLAHAAANLEVLTTGPQSDWVTKEIVKRSSTLSLLMALFLENWRYQFVFALPLPYRQPDEMTENEFYYAKRVDIAMRAVMELNDLRLQELESLTPSDRAQEMLTTIKDACAGADLPDRRPTRPTSDT